MFLHLTSGSFLLASKLYLYIIYDFKANLSIVLLHRHDTVSNEASALYLMFKLLLLMICYVASQEFKVYAEILITLLLKQTIYY